MTNKLYALIGASGSGKSTLGAMVFGAKNKIKSTTTRKIRDGEFDGGEYRFFSEEQFCNAKEQGLFAECDTYDGKNYGILKSDIEDALENGDAYSVLTYHGYEQIKNIYGDAVVSVFVCATKTDIREMLVGRGSGVSEIERRMSLYEEDSKNMSRCDYTVFNFYEEFNLTYNQMVKIRSGDMYISANPPKYVAIDFDGTIVDDSYPGIGEIKPLAKQVINKFVEQGGRVMIHTCRDGVHEEMVKNFLKSNEISFDTINENHPEMMAKYKNDPRKLGADLYIDDKGLGVAEINWLDIAPILGVRVSQLKNI